MTKLSFWSKNEQNDIRVSDWLLYFMQIFKLQNKDITNPISMSNADKK